jgi:hypothetical protein
MVIRSIEKLNVNCNDIFLQSCFEGGRYDEKKKKNTSKIIKISCFLRVFYCVFVILNFMKAFKYLLVLESSGAKIIILSKIVRCHL